MSKRDNSVTIAKGIAIMLMVLGHAGAPSYLSFLSTIRMPLFFFMSGYCFKDKYLEMPKQYFKRRISGIYVPYIKWALFFLLFHNLFFYIGLYNDTFVNLTRIKEPLHLYTMAEYFVTALNIVTGMSGEEIMVGGFWFLKSLFVGSIIFYFFAKLKSPIIQLSILLLITIGLKFIWLNIPWINVSAREFLAAFFITAGYTYKKKNFTIHYNIWLSLLLLCYVIVITQFINTNMNQFYWKNTIPYAFSALCGTISIFAISSKLDKLHGTIHNFLIYIGNHTFQVLTWHHISFRIVTLLIIIIYNLPHDYLAQFPVIIDETFAWAWPIYTLVGISVPILGIWLYEKFWKLQ